MFKKNLPFLISLLSILAGCFLTFEALPAYARSNSTSDEISATQLPVQAQTTYSLIQQGGPFPYAKDGVVFGNYERQLPQKKRGYYHEYTVKTPATKNRGAQRIVCGGLKSQVPDICYYTNDHYATFKRINP